jgi:hypothetical protein
MLVWLFHSEGLTSWSYSSQCAQLMSFKEIQDTRSMLSNFDMILAGVTFNNSLFDNCLI